MKKSHGKPILSASQVIKIEAFEGSLPKRPLYIYLPPGYTEETNRIYPVLYMHDGQNCFERFVADSYAGSWQADLTADRLIAEGRMRPCLIVGVGNGSEERIAEYLPPYATYPLPPRNKKGSTKTTDEPESEPERPLMMTGRARETAVYYRDEVTAYMRQHYRVDSHREQTATCGSSMGGLLSTYFAWTFPEFARHHAILSPAYWLTKTRSGDYETIERLRLGQPRDVRLWLDSGTQDAPGRGDDGWPETATARDALLQNGYQIGPDFQYFLAEGACHREADWAARLPQVFEFLFPTNKKC
jgi:predicted alpha/beta superfamily hydrolase